MLLKRWSLIIILEKGEGMRSNNDGDVLHDEYLLMIERAKKFIFEENGMRPKKGHSMFSHAQKIKAFNPGNALSGFFFTQELLSIELMEDAASRARSLLPMI
jgi:hypothetical protein